MARVRITSIGTPWLSFSWEYLDSDKDVVRRVLNFLEDRRILYEPLNAQLFDYVGQSAAEIREMLTRELGTGRSVGEQLAKCLENIRAEVRRFMSDLEKVEALKRSGGASPTQIRDRQILALGEMRGRVNPVIAFLAYKYDIEVEQELAAALQPPEDTSSN